MAEVMEQVRAVESELRAQQELEARRIELHGEGRPFINADFHDHKFIAIGPEIQYSKRWRTFADFLYDYAIQLLGEDWFNAEIGRSPQERHPVMAWRWGHFEACARLQPGPDGLLFGAPTGDQAALLTLANDLYVLRHNDAFQADILGRLRHHDQFAGARYELFAAATCVRAGLSVRHEDERDRSRRHVEFIATHEATGHQLAVEAKQRQRGRAAIPGVHRPGVTSLVNRALTKRPGIPMVVFVDTDMDAPPKGTRDWLARFDNEVRKEMGRVEAHADGPLDANLILVSSTAYWRAGSDAAPPLMFFPHVPEATTFEVPETLLLRLCEAASKHRNIPDHLL